MKICGLDKYGGSPRWLTAEAYGPMVEIMIDGSEGEGSVMLTPDQVTAMMQSLAQVATMASQNNRPVEL